MTDMTSAPRVPSRPTSDWDEEVDEALASLRAHAPAGMAPPPGQTVRPESNILGIYAWHPKFIAGWMPFSNHLRHSTLSDAQREIVIIRTTWLGRGEYEWAQHVRMSRAGGYLTEGQIAALSEGPDASVWTSEESALVRATDEFCLNKQISDATWCALEDLLDRQQLIDLVFTIGTYDMHCTAFNALGLQLEDGMVGFPDGAQK